MTLGGVVGIGPLATTRRTGASHVDGIHGSDDNVDYFLWFGSATLGLLVFVTLLLGCWLLLLVATDEPLEILLTPSRALTCSTYWYIIRIPNYVINIW